MAGRISIRDLAAIASVSPTTVSLALRDSHRISASVRKRIQKIALENNYRSHPMVAALMHQIRTGRAVHNEEIIAFVTAGQSESHWRQWSWNVAIWEGAAAAANKLGFRLETFWAGPGAKNSEKLAEMLYHRGIRGLCFAPMPWPHPKFSMPWERFASVACTTSTGVPGLPVVRNNQYHGIVLLLAKLIELGAKSIGIALHDGEDMRIQRAWSAGIHGFCLDNKEAGVNLLRLKSTNDFNAFSAWFNEHRPDVVVGILPEIPVFLKTMGLTLGTDIAYASLNVQTEELGTMAGLYQNPFLLGKKAVQYISQAIYDQTLGLPENGESVMVNGQFVDGASLNALTKTAGAKTQPEKRPASKRRAKAPAKKTTG